MAKNNVVKIEEGKEKVQNLYVTYVEGDYVESKDQKDAYGDPIAIYITRKEVFTDIAGYQVNGDLIGISKRDGGQIVIPMRLIDRIETEFVNKE